MIKYKGCLDELLMVWTFVFKDVPYKYDDAYQA